FESVNNEKNQPEPAVKDVSNIRPHHNKRKKKNSILKRLFNWIFGNKTNRRPKRRYNNRNKKNFRGRNNNYRQNRDSRRDNRYRSDRNNRTSELSNRDSNRRRRNNGGNKNESSSEYDQNKKSNINQNKPISEYRTQNKEQGSHNRDRISEENLKHNQTSVDNSFPQSRIEETKKTESRENSTGSNPNLTENDSHREGNEKAGNNRSY
ncbi:hypothetical protein OA861_01725, partial [Pseudomonadota bacterium]|nr:hypothetical protein [Pseudomonadota bacterium]